MAPQVSMVACYGQVALTATCKKGKIIPHKHGILAWGPVFDILTCLVANKYIVLALSLRGSLPCPYT